MRRATTLLIVTLSMAAAPPATAQQGAAEIRGRVLDAQEGVLPRATVVLRNQETVLTSQFDAEFSRTAGAVVNAVTKQLP